LRKSLGFAEASTLPVWAVKSQLVRTKLATPAKVSEKETQETDCGVLESQPYLAENTCKVAAVSGFFSTRASCKE